MESLQGSILRQRGWKIIGMNNFVILCCVMGCVCTLYEKHTYAGSLSGDLNTLWNLEIKGFRSGLSRTFKFTLATVVFIKRITAELYIASYLAMICSFAFKGSKHVLVPWLILGGIRSVFAEIINVFTGLFICASFCEIKYSCLDFVVSKSVALACSSWLWSIIHELYKAECSASDENVRANLNINGPYNDSNSNRSLDSILAEAVVEWFLEEAERCKDFDSDLAFDEDIAKFEQDLTNRASKFLEMSPTEVLEKFKNKKKFEILREKINQAAQNIDPIIEDANPKNSNEIIKTENEEFSSPGLSGVDMENKNPLRKFPYLPKVHKDTDSELSKDGFGEDTPIGKKSVSVQAISITELPEERETTEHKLENNTSKPLE